MVGRRSALRGFCRHHSPNWGKDLGRPWEGGRRGEGEAYPEADHDCKRKEYDVSGRCMGNHRVPGKRAYTWA